MTPSCLFGAATFDWEWNPSFLALRAALERRFESEVTALVGAVPEVAPADLPAYLMELGRPPRGRSLSQYVKREAGLQQFTELLVHRSVYSLMEADHHSLAIPRIRGGGKPALVEIQADEYGGGIPGRLHSQLFALTMRELGLDPRYGTYVESVTAPSLANVNLISLFGMHARHRGALLGNLAITEIGSHHVNRNLKLGLDRLGGSDLAQVFFQEHVVADAVHEQLAAHDMCGRFAQAHPEETASVVLGALASAAVGTAANEALLQAWEQGCSSLREPVPAGTALPEPELV
ncbi:MAG: iron-containing redox enzyme family protein [Kineosporiaceae bacterium]